MPVFQIDRGFQIKYPTSWHVDESFQKSIGTIYLWGPGISWEKIADYQGAVIQMRFYFIKDGDYSNVNQLRQTSFFRAALFQDILERLIP